MLATAHLCQELTPVQPNETVGVSRGKAAETLLQPLLFRVARLESGLQHHLLDGALQLAAGIQQCVHAPRTSSQVLLNVRHLQFLEPLDMPVQHPRNQIEEALGHRVLGLCASSTSEGTSPKPINHPLYRLQQMRMGVEAAVNAERRIPVDSHFACFSHVM